MKKIEFKKIKDSITNTIFIKLEYMSGDADAYEYEEYPLGTEITFSNYTEYLDEIEKIVEQYQLISRFTDCNDKLHLGDKRWGLKIGEDKAYDYIKDNYSNELADLYESVPGDSTCDGQRKAHLSSIKLGGYNDKGEYFESYV